MKNQQVKFIKSTRQAKLKSVEQWLGKKNIYSFNLPSGHTCPFALDCMSKSDRVTGKITDGKHTKYRCFSATDEARSPTARNQRWHNFEALRKLDKNQMVEVISQSIPDDMEVCRIHVSGDFFNQKYFDAWVEIAKLNPLIIFYAYTKSIPYWVNRLDEIPRNLELNSSRGSRVDNLIDDYELKTAEVVFSIGEAEKKNLEIDHNEYYALNDLGNFALLIHGTQPKNSSASEAIKNLKKNNIKFSYS
jgi:hypothetical protein